MLDKSNSKPENNNKSKLLWIINLINLACDIFLSVLINILTKFTPAAIILGISLVLIRVLVKLICIDFNYREPCRQESPFTTEMPNSWANLIVLTVLISLILVAAATYFINKSFSFKALLGKSLASSIFFNICLYVIAIWAVLSFFISVLPAIFYRIGKMQKSEHKTVFTERVFSSTKLEIEGDNTISKSSYVDVNPIIKATIKDINLEDINKMQNAKKQKDVENIEKEYPGFSVEHEYLLYQGQVVQQIEVDESKNQATLSLYEYNKETNKVKCQEKDITPKSWGWNIIAFLTSKGIKMPSSIIDFLTDIPFTYLTIVYSGYNKVIIYFLICCIPLMLCECLVYNLNYFFKGKMANKERVSFNDLEQLEDYELNRISKGEYDSKKRKSSIVYYLLTGAAYISAFSKMFIKSYTLYKICTLITHNPLMAAIFAFISAFIYSVRNIANVANAQPTLFLITHSWFLPLKPYTSSPPSPASLTSQFNRGDSSFPVVSPDPGGSNEPGNLNISQIMAKQETLVKAATPVTTPTP